MTNKKDRSKVFFSSGGFTMGMVCAATEPQNPLVNDDTCPSSNSKADT